MRQAIGIDIGGTSIKGAVVDEQGTIIGERRRATDASQGRDHILGGVRAVVEELRSSYPGAVGIGVGTAGRVDADAGVVAYATDNLPGWQGTRIREILEAEFGLPVQVDNDANAALLGEHWVGAGRGYADLVMLTLGTGVGGANMIRGELVRGANWNGGEWGHVILKPGGLACNCGQAGCIEQYVSGTALVNAARSATGKPYAAGGAEVFADYRAGDPRIAQVLHRYMDDLTVVVHNLHLGVNPQAILIGGGVADAGGTWWELLAGRVEKLGLGIVVRPAALGNNAGAIGAARLALLEG